ncbi:hypothetical protein N7530_009516 [Penicillium desertorum]|uniref:Uncharacterized protein n=1 Tax=Penicillium desertorum TaxID=1303715 RepID=A0A9X0BI73_9EURO|nr:hypothetical protein N7530_009516 [Penicillium desertorum]
MDTGAGRDQVDPSFEPSLFPTENTGHKRKLSSPNDQCDPARAGEKKQSVLDGFFLQSQGHVLKAPVPTTNGKGAEAPFNKSGKGSKQSYNDGWESDWESDVSEKDDHSPIGDDDIIRGPEGEDCSVGGSPCHTNIQSSIAEMLDLDLTGQLFKTIRDIVFFLK